MKKLIVIVFVFLFLCSCESNGQSHNSILEHSQDHIEFVQGFESAYDDFHITSVEYIEDEQYMYYLISYEGYYIMNIDILNIHAGDLLDSSSLCRNAIGTNSQECVNGFDVSGNLEISQSFRILLKDKNENNYYVFQKDEITEITGG